LRFWVKQGNIGHLFTKIAIPVADAKERVLSQLVVSGRRVTAFILGAIDYVDKYLSCTG